MEAKLLVFDFLTALLIPLVGLLSGYLAAGKDNGKTQYLYQPVSVWEQNTLLPLSFGLVETPKASGIEESGFGVGDIIQFVDVVPIYLNIRYLGNFREKSGTRYLFSRGGGELISILQGETLPGTAWTLEEISGRGLLIRDGFKPQPVEAMKLPSGKWEALLRIENQGEATFAEGSVIEVEYGRFRIETIQEHMVSLEELESGKPVSLTIAEEGNVP